ncbi:NADH-quinone oxidoreductase subunit C [Thermococcus sp. ES12]|uniref:NADH-quinone oxidoreductase subunit C n=1 Tax=Thermococcus sp. ES12 TaxID=1638246 RepID=UPI001431388E|nr:NADH-quinone oxidoreductase subunit C [Thermococcus sp. ES12]NJE76591.1 hydrogenase [Thermococcus sp. ES12]
MNVDEFVKVFSERFPGAEIRVSENKMPHPKRRVWVEIDREKFHDAMKFIKELDPRAQFSIIIGIDAGDRLLAKYHMEMFWEEGESLSLVIGTSVPKDDPKLPTVTDVFPSALPYERENQEFLGLFFEGIPDPRRLFLPDDFPEGIYPLRLDETGIRPEMVKNAGHPYKIKKEGSK